MIGSTELRPLVSGQRRGWVAAGLRLALSFLEIPFQLLVRARNLAYERGIFEKKRVAVPVISVGNLTVGGVGKTPLVVWLARWFRSRGIRVSIVSRGYGAEQGGRNDEAMELELRLPDVPHAQHANRFLAAQIAIEEFETQLIVLDDAFQHRRLHRDLDIVVVDALCPFGYGHVLPRGLLREPISALRRADLVVISRCDLVSDSTRQTIWEQVTRVRPETRPIEGVHRPSQLVSTSGVVQPISELAGNRIAAFCGIGNPEGFRGTLESCGAKLVGWREFPDHYRYQKADIDLLSRWVGELNDVKMVVCTAKDLVKLGVDQLSGRPLVSLVVDFAIQRGEELLMSELEKCLAKSVA